jgi:hypothetical protein
MIKPRCLIYKMPMFLSADNKLKPCCFLNTTSEWVDFIKWCKERSLDAEYDLDITKHSIDTIIKSPSWKALLDSFDSHVGSPGTCRKNCGPNSYTSTSQTAKHSDYTGDKN